MQNPNWSNLLITQLITNITANSSKVIRLGIQRVSFNRGIIAIHNQLDVIWDGSPAVLSTGKSPNEHLNVNIIELNEFFV